MKNQIHSKRVKAAIESQEAWEHEYIDLTTAAMRFYSIANRHRFACRLQHELALLYLKRGDFDKGVPLLNSVCGTYWDDHWFTIYFATKKLLAQCERAFGHTSAFVQSCINLLKVAQLKECDADEVTCMGFQNGMLEIARSDTLKSYLISNLNALVNIKNIKLIASRTALDEKNPEFINSY